MTEDQALEKGFVFSREDDEYNEDVPTIDVASHSGAMVQFSVASPDTVASIISEIEDSEQSLDQLARRIENVLADYGMGVEVVEVKAGPTAVRFGIRPGWSTSSISGGNAQREKKTWLWL